MSYWQASRGRGKGIFRKDFRYPSRIMRQVYPGIEQGTVVIDPADWPPAAGVTAKPLGLHLIGRQYAAIAAHRLGGVLQ